MPSRAWERRASITDWLARVKGVITVLLAAAGMFASARTIVVQTQPVSPWPDTEVSTNVVLHRDRTDTRKLHVHFQFEGTPTNGLEVAFGRDENTNGVLDVAETETVYGWRAGRYFIENARDWERHEVSALANATDGVVDIHLENDSAFVPKRFTATCGGETAFARFAARPPPWLFRADWTHARVTRRGKGVPPEWVRCDIGYTTFVMKFR